MRIHKLILTLLFVPLVTAIGVNNPNLPHIENINNILYANINYSTINVNNSDYLDNIDSTRFCQFNTQQIGNISVANGSVITSWGDAKGLTYMVHFFAGNRTQNFSIISGQNAIGTGFQWGTGSRLIATTTRMIYTPDNDWIDILNEAGNKYMMSIKLASVTSYSNSGARTITNDTGLYVNGTIQLKNGGKVWDNSTCTFISSPDGSTVQEVCNA